MKIKQKIGLICDEGADLPKEIIEEYQISVVPFKIDFGQLGDIPGNIYQKIREAEKRGIKSFIKTSQPSVGDFLFAFREKFKNFEEIICLTFSSKLSGTFNSAIQAENFLEKESQEKISVVDSLNASAGEGLLIIKVASLIERGLTFEEILENLEKSRPKIRVIGMLEDPKWLEASGRLSHFVASWIRQMQRIGVRPLLGLKKGKIGAMGIKRAKDIPEALCQEFELRISRLQGLNLKIKAAITHADNSKGAERLKEMIETKLKNVEIVFLNIIGNILGGHLGPGALILAWEEI